MINLRRLQKQENFLRVSILPVLAITVILLAILSASWRLQHDTALMIYCTLLMDKFNAVPYVDFFDMNAPGVYFGYWLIVKIFGYGDVGLRIADFVILGGIMVAMWSIQRTLNRWAAWTSILLFGVLYLGEGQMLSLQRENIILLGLVIALWIAVRPKQWNIMLRAFLIGVLFGVIFSMRPPIAITFPFILLYLIFDLEKPLSLRAVLLTVVMGLGSLIPLLATGFYLWRSGAWDAFWEMVRGYWPLYIYIDLNLHVREGADRVNYLISETLNANLNPGLMLSSTVILFCTLIWARVSKEQRNLILLLAGLFVAALMFPALSGKFWNYHWLPFFCFASFAAGWMFLTVSQWANIPIRRIVAVFGLVAVFIGGLMNIRIQSDVFWNPAQAIPENGSADMLSDYFHKNLKPGETVQVLGLVGGGIHALLMNQMEQATPYIYDFYFYHHIDQPFIQHIQKDFIEKLNTAKPRFVVREPYPTATFGMRDARSFPELEEFLTKNYRIAESIENHYTIYERITP